jgi:hypothetical protein
MDDHPLAVQSRLDLAAFVDSLSADLAANPGDWENATLPAFLDALARYLVDLPGWCRNMAPDIDPEVAQWRLIAVALTGASVYE